MCKFFTVKEYVEASLYTWKSSCRFSVLEHLFCTLGNGVAVTEDGYLEERCTVHPKHKRAERLLRKISLGPSYRIKRDFAKRANSLRARRGSPLEEIISWEDYVVEEMPKHIDWKERYAAEPKVIEIYRFSENPDFQPFRKYVGLNCPDILDSVKYFVDVVKSSEFNEEEFFNKYEIHRMGVFRRRLIEECEERKQSLENWKSNIHLVEECFGV